MNKIKKELEDIGFERQETDPKQLVVDALMQLDGSCDGARTHDDMGFAAFHTAKGKQTAAYFRNLNWFRVDQLEFMRNALPYYKNTQLNWVDWDEFEEGIARWLEVAVKVELSYSEFRKKVTQDESYTFRLFSRMTVDHLKEKHREGFMKSLQDQLRRKGRLSVKQMYWVCRFVEEAYPYREELEKEDG